MTEASGKRNRDQRGHSAPLHPAGGTAGPAPRDRSAGDQLSCRLPV